MSNRIPCLNPNCRRTAPADKYAESEAILCRACWRKLPKRITDRWKALNKRERRLLRLIQKRINVGAITLPEVEALQAMHEQRWSRLWAQVHSYFNAPEHPEGLEAFMDEIGL